MKNLLAVAFFLIPVLCLSQERILLRGKAISDQSPVEFLKVKNLATGQLVQADENAVFSIPAQSGDELEFSSPAFKTLKHILVSKDFTEELFVVRMIPSAILLDEVELSGLTGSLFIDSRSTGVFLINERFKSDFDSEYLNLGQIGQNPSLNLDCIAVFGLVKNAIVPSDPVKRLSKRDRVSPKVERKAFSKVLKENYPLTFFTDTINVPRERVGLFLNFCDDTAKSYLLDPKNEIALIIYLKETYSQFAKQYHNNEN